MCADKNMEKQKALQMVVFCTKRVIFLLLPKMARFLRIQLDWGWSVFTIERCKGKGKIESDKVQKKKQKKVP